MRHGVSILALVIALIARESEATACSSYVSSVSTYGLDTCDDSYNMPYAFAMHFHPTYDSDSAYAAYQLQEAFKQYFGVEDCNEAEESTLYSTDSTDNTVACFMATAPASGKCSTSDKSDETTFPECQYGIYVPTEKLFDSSLQASTASYTYTKGGNSRTYSFDSNLSPWVWMSKYKDGFYSSSSSSSKSDIDIFVHASLTCPKLAHSTWATFIYPYGSTAAATGITGDYGADGCYGKTCAGCPSTSKNGGDSYTDSGGCCSLSLVSEAPTSFSSKMATGYINLLRAIAVCSNSAGPDSSCKSMSDPLTQGTGRRRRYKADEMTGSTPEAVFPQWIWESGCSGDGCSRLDSVICPSTCGSGRRRKCSTTTTCPSSEAVTVIAVEGETTWQEKPKMVAPAVALAAKATQEQLKTKVLRHIRALEEEVMKLGGDDSTSTGTVNEECMKAAKARCLKDKRCSAKLKRRNMNFFRHRCTKGLYSARAKAREEHHKCMKIPSCRARFFGATKRCLANKHCKARYLARRAKYHEIRMKRLAAGNVSLPIATGLYTTAEDDSTLDAIVGED